MLIIKYDFLYVTLHTKFCPWSTDKQNNHAFQR